jgi:hypothetical protein
VTSCTDLTRDAIRALRTVLGRGGVSQTRPVRFPKPDRSLVILVCLFLLALTPRLLFLASIPQGAVLEAVDAQGYDLLARNLRAGHGFSLQDAPPPSMSSGQH